MIYRLAGVGKFRCRNQSRKPRADDDGVRIQCHMKPPNSNGLTSRAIAITFTSTLSVKYRASARSNCSIECRNPRQPVRILPAPRPHLSLWPLNGWEDGRSSRAPSLGFRNNAIRRPPVRRLFIPSVPLGRRSGSCPELPLRETFAAQAPFEVLSSSTRRSIVPGRGTLGRNFPGQRVRQPAIGGVGPFSHFERLRKQFPREGRGIEYVRFWGR